jgi:tRNA threonylcarbamoyladenosine biosynthesis protein TsaE
MALSYSYKSLEELPKAAEFIIREAENAKTWAFYGSMGAGKTTLIKEICRQLGSADIVTSPTFSLINEYKNLAGESIFHFDFYRIIKKEEVFDMGYEEYLFSNSLCLIEWPELIEDLLPPKRINIFIKPTPNGGRLIEIDSTI